MKRLLTFVCLLASFASCTKTTTDELDTDEILRSGNWGIVGYTVKFPLSADRDSVYNILGNSPDCRSDDYITFEANFKGVQHSGGKKCSSELDAAEFDWKLVDNQRTLIINNAPYTVGNVNDASSIFPKGGLDYVAAKITRITERSFTIVYTKELPTVPGSAPTKYEFTQVFQK